MPNVVLWLLIGIFLIVIISALMAPRQRRLRKKYFGFYRKYQRADDYVSIKVCDIIAAAYGESNNSIVNIKPDMKMDNIHFVLTAENHEYDEIIDVISNIESAYGIRLPYEGFNMKSMTVGDLINEVKKCLNSDNRPLKGSA